MAVTIRAKFTPAQVKKMMAERVALIEKAILLRLQRVGESFVVNARENGGYNDVTGNLRSSIGYVILKDGRQLVDNFQRSTKVKASGDQGVATGRKVAEEAAQRFTKGIVLICVAGMDYAAAVESKGKDVITASSKIAEDDLKKSLAELSGKLSRMT